MNTNETTQGTNRRNFLGTLATGAAAVGLSTIAPSINAFAGEANFDHKVYGEIWNKIYDEYELTKHYVFMLSGKSELMASYPVEQLSVQMRERIVLPLTTIQQYAITRVREMEEELIQTPLKSTYEKLVMRSSFGIINAGRNSA